jgi:hypothetical protein
MSLNISHLRYYWLKLRALAKAHEWIKLEEFCKSKKPPIGYEVNRKYSN